MLRGYVNCPLFFFLPFPDVGYKAVFPTERVVDPGVADTRGDKKRKSKGRRKKTLTLREKIKRGPHFSYGRDMLCFGAAAGIYIQLPPSRMCVAWANRITGRGREGGYDVWIL